MFWLIPNLLYGMCVQGYHFTAEKLEVLMLKGRENDLGETTKATKPVMELAFLN